jgi:NTE family protein
MAYHFKNLVFEGGGVKGIAYVGAMEVLEQKAITKQISRVGGTSAGAINAVLFAAGYSNSETLKILKNLNFNNFLDDSWGLVRDTKRLVEDFGWYKGDFFHDWISKLVNQKLGSPNVTFRDLKEAKRPDLYVYGTNLSTRFGEVFSVEHTPSTRIADAVRISMSIPLFFAAFKNARKDVYVDGGVLNNYPVKLFDREKYLSGPANKSNSLERSYYVDENKKFMAGHPNSSPYTFNKETLGFRLDTKREIGIFRDGAQPQHTRIDDFFEYVKALVGTIIDAQGTAHLHSDDWHRTVYVDTLGVGAIEFDISDTIKNKLRQSGKKGATEYFKWFDDPKNTPYNRP